MMGQSTVENAVLNVRRTYAVSREKVFRAWTEPEALKRWFAPTDAHTTPITEVDLRPGGSYRIDMQSPGGDIFQVSGTYQEIIPPEKLVFTWKWRESEIEPAETLVTIEFYEEASGTLVLLTHERFSNQKSSEEHGHGWGGCLDHLDRFLAQGM